MNKQLSKIFSIFLCIPLLTLPVSAISQNQVNNEINPQSNTTNSSQNFNNKSYEDCCQDIIKKLNQAPDETKMSTHLSRWLLNSFPNINIEELEGISNSPENLQELAGTPNDSSLAPNFYRVTTISTPFGDVKFIFVNPKFMKYCKSKKLTLTTPAEKQIKFVSSQQDTTVNNCNHSSVISNTICDFHKLKVNNGVTDCIICLPVSKNENSKIHYNYKSIASYLDNNVVDKSHKEEIEKWICNYLNMNNNNTINIEDFNKQVENKQADLKNLNVFKQPDNNETLRKHLAIFCGILMVTEPFRDERFAYWARICMDKVKQNIDNDIQPAYATVFAGKNPSFIPALPEGKQTAIDTLDLTNQNPETLFNLMDIYDIIFNKKIEHILQDIKYKLDNMTLTISGCVYIKNFNSQNPSPFYKNNKSIKLIITEDWKPIGENIFYHKNSPSIIILKNFLDQNTITNSVNNRKMFRPKDNTTDYFTHLNNFSDLTIKFQKKPNLNQICNSIEKLKVLLSPFNKFIHFEDMSGQKCFIDCSCNISELQVRSMWPIWINLQNQKMPHKKSA